MEEVKVISGLHKKRKLKTPKPLYGNKTEPASSRIKSAIFSMLNPYIDNKAAILDLYAGTGQLGIEALSRGAKFAAFVDISENATETIKENLQNLGLADQAFVIKSEVISFLTTPHVRIRNTKFDIIFIDPPYDKTSPKTFYEIITLSKNMLAPGGILVVRHPKKLELENKIPKEISSRWGENVRRTKGVPEAHQNFVTNCPAHRAGQFSRLNPRAKSPRIKPSRNRESDLILADSRKYGKNRVSFFVLPLKNA